MLRIYRLGSLVGFAVVILLVSAIFIAPAFAAIPRTEIAKRLCDRQKDLGKRLSIQLIDPAQCADAPPPPTTATLTLIKVLPNDSGGVAVAADFQAKIDGSNVPWGSAQTVSVGAHTASEVEVFGYDAGDWGGDCAADGTITLAEGEDKTCTITNDDQQGTLHVVKVVMNDSGGTATTSDFSFGVNGFATTTFEVDGQNDLTLNAGTYTIIETATSTYAVSYDNCTDVVVSNGGSATCTITNNDVAPATPLLSFSANPTSVHEGSASDATTTLTWDSTNATSCVASNVTGWSGAKAVDDSEVVTPTATSAYQLDCIGPGGSVQATTTVTFVPVTPTEGKLLITEVLYDLATSTPAQGVESANEWVEIFNGTNATVDLTGYTIHDSAGSDAIPAGTLLPAGKFLVITSTSTTASFYSIPADAVVVVLSTNIGSNGLGNSGDMVELQNASTVSVDAVSWGDNTTAFTPSVPNVAVNFGHSIARINNQTDTNTAADWAENATPTPGI